MKLYILGQNSDDKGSQLENLTKRILTKYGLTNVTKDEVSAGGNEIDVTAEIVQNAGLSEIRIPVICECKAYEDTVSMPHWLKFLGKLYVAKKSHAETQGYFIALSGVNGNVWSNYKFLGEDLKDSSIHLIGKDDLTTVIERDFNLPNRKSIEKHIAQFTHRHINDMSFVYYNNQVYWAIEFNDSTYTLFSDNKFVTTERWQKLKKLLRVLPLGNYVDIETEYESKQRELTLEGLCLCAVILGCNSIEAINTLIYEPLHGRFSFAEDEIVTTLNRIPYIKKVDDQFTLNTNSIHESPVNFYLYLFDRPFIPKVIGTTTYQNFINENLLTTISSIQSGMIIPDDYRQRCLKILQLSPRALAESIKPIAFITNALRNGSLHNDINRVAFEKYLGLIIDCIQSDLTKQVYWEEFYETFNINNYSFVRELVINPEQSDSIILRDAPLVKFAKVENIPGNPIVPIVEFDKSQI